MTSDWPESDLIAGSRTEPTLFAEIFDRHHSELYRYLRRRVGQGLAADLAAETFVTAFARPGAYRPQSPNARPWLYGIAHNLLRNYLRHEERRLAAYARLGAEPIAGLTWAGLQHLAAAPVQLEAALVNAASGAGMPLTQAASEFAVIASLLAMGPASPALRSALYQLAARLPGLVVVLHAHDLLGRSATEVWAPGRVQIYPTALYFNPSTGAVLDLALHRATARCPALREDALLASGYVSSAYRLPPRAVHKPWPLAKLSPSCDILPTPEP